MKLKKTSSSFIYIIACVIGGLLLQTFIYGIWFYLWISHNLSAGNITLFKLQIAEVIEKNSTFTVTVNPISAFYIWIVCTILIALIVFLVNKIRK